MKTVNRSARIRIVAAAACLVSGAVLVAVAIAAPPATIRGNVDAANRIGGGAVLDVYGWAADEKTGAPVQRVEVLFNGKVAAVATLGLSRPDVVQALKRRAVLKSGWNARIDLRKQPRGSYRLTARAFNAKGESAPLIIAKVDIRVP